MQERDHILFDLVKKRIVEVMRATYPGIPPSIAEWKGQEITDFQEELRRTVNANVSEKWFYTHMKSTAPSLPRIDMLNILSRYAGYSNWDDFVFRHGSKDQESRQAQGRTVSISGGDRYFILVPVIAMAVAALLFGFFLLFNTRQYRFIMVDGDTGEPITGPGSTVVLLAAGESPVNLQAGSDGAFRLKTSAGRIRLVPRSPFYRTDTIDRILKKFETEVTLPLQADDYALAVHYLAAGDTGSWENRRKQLGRLFDDGAMICRMETDNRRFRTIALYNKQEFIDLLTLPSGTLQQMEILETRERDGRIVMLSFHVTGTYR